MKTTSVWIFALTLLLSPTAAFAQSAKPLRHTVIADGHPIAVWEKSASNATEAILLIHGRTWSALPDFDLQVKGEELSLMDGLVEAGYAVFAIDLRGYGSTPRDASQWLTPNRSADDVAVVADWIDSKSNWSHKPHLFGWSMGSTIAQLTVQRHPDSIESLILFGYWFDEDVPLPTDPADTAPLRQANTAEAAASDFITPGTISEKAVKAYVASALKADPVRVDARGSEQYNSLDASRIKLPVLVIAGELDPFAPPALQAKVYARLGSSHKQYRSLAGADHAAFLETARPEFLTALVGFLKSIPPRKQ